MGNLTVGAGMAFRPEEQSLVVQAAFWTTLTVLLFGLATFLITIAVVLVKTGSLVERVEDRELGNGQRMGQRFSRLTPFLTDPSFRTLRATLVGSMTAVLLSFIVLFAMIASLGR